jgi:GntR family transcriptional regulator
MRRMSRIRNFSDGLQPAGELPDAPALDRGSPIPLYYQVKQHLSAQIATGELAPSQQLPGEHGLCRLYEVSRTVIRQALNELAYEGLIDKRRGKGTFVAKTKVPEGLMSGLAGLADDVAQRGQTLESRVLALREEPATASVATRLHVQPGERVVELVRQRLVDGEPWVLTVSYLPAQLVPGLVDCDFSRAESLYNVLRQAYGLPIISSTRRVEAAVADEREAPLLGVRSGDPVIVLRSLSFTTGMRPVEYFVAHHRGDQSAFEVVLAADDAGVQITHASKLIHLAGVKP